MRALILVNALLLISLPSLCLADVLVLSDGTLVEGDVQGLLTGKIKSIPGPDGKAVTLTDAAATHVGSTIEQFQAELKAAYAFYAAEQQRKESDGDQLDFFDLSTTLQKKGLPFYPGSIPVTKQLDLKLRLKKHLKSFSSFRNDRIWLSAGAQGIFNSDEIHGRLSDEFNFRLKNLEIVCTAFNNDTRRFLLVRQSEGVSDTNYEYRLADDVENEVRRHSIVPDDHDQYWRLSDMDRIKPGQFAGFLLTFEAPLPKTEYLILDVSKQMFEYGDKLAHPSAYRFLFPYSFDIPGSDRTKNHLKLIGLAMHNFHEVHGRFPSDIRDEDGKPLLSWRVQLLPFLDHITLFDQFNLDEPWDSPNNKPLIAKMPAVLRAPGSKAEAARTNYVGLAHENGIFRDGAGIRIADIVDGTSNTIMIAEADDKQAVTWTKPDDLEFDPKKPHTGLGKLRDGSFYALLGDGAVRKLSIKISADLLRRLADRADGETVTLD